VIIRILFAALGVASIIITAAAAEPEKVKRKRVVQTQPTALWPGASSMAPARMIEVRPGYWVSSYGCVFEDAQGRLLDCQTSGDNR